MADRYLVASGNVTWTSANTAIWSTSSGGSTGASVPTASDDVYIDANSGTGLIKFATVVCRNLDFTGFAGSWQHDSAASSLTISGSLVMSATMSTDGWTAGTFTFNATTDNGGVGWPITTNGKTLGVIIFNGVGGKWTLQDDLSCGPLSHAAGHFSTGANRSVNVAGQWAVTGVAANKFVTLGSSAITCTNTVAHTGSLTVYDNTATVTCAGIIALQLSYPGTSFVVGGAATNPQITPWGGSSSFANLTLSGASLASVRIDAPLYLTGTFTATGINSTTSRLLVNSITLGTPVVISAAAVSLTDVDFMDIAIIGPNGSTITSDSFNRADSALIGSSTDTADGGTAKTWVDGSRGSTHSIVSNQLRRNESGLFGGYVYIDAGSSDVSVSWKVLAGNDAGVGLNGGPMARYDPATGNNIGFFTTSTTTARVSTSIASTNTNTSAVTIALGDTLTLRVKGNAYVALRNGVPVITGTVPSALVSTNNVGLGSYARYIADYDDFKVQEIPNVTGTRLGDCLGNSGITFTTASGTPRDGGGAGVKRYAVAPGNFSSTAMWSETSGGAPGASVPLPQDDVYLDANSAAGTYTIDMTRVCRNLDATGFTRTLAYPSSVTNNFYGSFTLPLSGFTWSGTNTLNMLFRGRSSHTITTPTWPSFANASPAIYAFGGTYTAGSDLNNLNNFALMSGTLDINNFNWSLKRMVVGTGTTLSMGSGTLILGEGSNAGTHWSFSPTATLNGSSSTITLAFPDTAGRSYGFDGGGKVYGTLNHTASGQAGALVITGSNTFNTLNIGSGRTLRLTSGTTQKIGTLNIDGQNLSKVVIRGNNTGDFRIPHRAGQNITGDLEIVARIEMTNWNATPDALLIRKWESSNSQRAWQFAYISGGVLQLGLTDVGGTSKVVSSTSSIAAGSGVRWLKVTWNATTKVVQFFTASDSPTEPIVWTQLGTDVTHNIPSVFASTEPVRIATYNNPTSLRDYSVLRLIARNSGVAIVDVDFTRMQYAWLDISQSPPVSVTAQSLGMTYDGRAVIESVTTGSAATLQVDSTTGMNYVDLRDVVMNGADTYIGATSVIRSNVKGVRRGPKTGLGV